MTDDERAALLAAIEPSVGPATRNYILYWAEHIRANATLLESALAGDVVLTGFDMNANEPHWDQRLAAAPRWLTQLLDR